VLHRRAASAQIRVALTAVKGVGRRFADIVLKKAEVDTAKRAGELSAAELESAFVVIGNPRSFRVPDWALNRRRDMKDGRNLQLVSNQLDTKLREDIERMKKSASHRVRASSPGSAC
jgi:small subunit ribosomal protein S18e